MTVIERLERYTRVKAQLRHILLELAEARARSEGVRAIQYADGPKTQNTERDLSDVLARLEQDTGGLKEAANKCLREMRIVEAAARGLDDERERRVTWARYIDGKTWAEVEQATGITRRHAYRIQHKALTHMRFIDA